MRKIQLQEKNYREKKYFFASLGGHALFPCLRAKGASLVQENLKQNHF